MDKPFKIYKEISVVPTPYIPNAMYCVRAGAGVDIYVSNSTGTAIHKHNSSAAVEFETLQQDPISPAIGLGWLTDTRIDVEGEYYGLGYIGTGEVSTTLKINTTGGVRQVTLI
jgi:hypothetical protein